MACIQVLTRLLFSLALVDHDIAGAEDCKQLLLSWSRVGALAAYMLYLWLYIGIKYVAGFVLWAQIHSNDIQHKSGMFRNSQSSSSSNYQIKP
jgi:hypothetical protein